MKIRNTLIVFFLGLLAALPVRIYQILYTVDYSNGFYPNSDVTAIILPVLLFLCAVIMPVMAFSAQEYPKFAPTKKAPVMGVFSLLSASVIGFTCAGELINSESARFTGTPGLVCNSLGLICVLSFFFLSVSFFRGDNMIEKTPLVLALPIAWMALRMTLIFLNITTVANISESKYDVLTMAFMMLFLLSMAKFMSGAGGKSSKWIFATGGSAAMFAFVSNIPRYVLWIDIKTNGLRFDRINDSFLPNSIDTVLALFTVALMFHITKSDYARGSQQVKHMLQPSLIPPISSRRMHQAQQKYARYANSPHPAYGTTAYGSNAYDVNKYGAVASRGPSGAPTSPALIRSQYTAMRAAAANGGQTLLAGGGADQYTSKGAGMRITEDFSLRSAYSDEIGGRYGGLGDFRTQIKGGRRALDVLESSNSKSLPGFKPLSLDISDIEIDSDDQKRMITAQNKELENMTKAVDKSLGSLLAFNANASRGPKEVSIDALPDDSPEAAAEAAEVKADPNAPKAVRLGTGLTAKLSEQNAAADGQPQQNYGRRATDKVMYGRRATDRMDFDGSENQFGFYPPPEYQRPGRYIDPYSEYPPAPSYDDGYAEPYAGGYDQSYDDQGYGEYEYGSDDYDYEYTDSADTGDGYDGSGYYSDGDYYGDESDEYADGEYEDGDYEDYDYDYGDDDYSDGYDDGYGY